MSQNRNFCYTLNNPTNEEIQSLKDITLNVRFHVFQIETGENGTEHVQGFIQLERARAFSYIKRLLQDRSHIEVMRGTVAQAIAYCTKEESRSGESFTMGEPLRQGQRRDVEGFVSSIKEGLSNKELIEKHPNEFVLFTRAIMHVRNAYILPRTWEMVNIVYWGRSGSGKTRRATEEAGDNVYYISKGDNNQSVWWDGYNGQEAVILDDFYGWLPWSMLLRLLDRYPFDVQSKGGSRPFTSKRIFITSNTEPITWYKSVVNDDHTPLLRRLNKVEKLD